MIQIHLTNGMVQTSFATKLKENAQIVAKKLRALDLFASIFKDEETKEYTIWVPRNCPIQDVNFLLIIQTF